MPTGPPARRLVGILAWCAVACGACSRPGSARLPERVILLGFDGASPNLLEPLVEQGKLPAIRRLMESGVYGRLGSFQPTKSGILWTSVATGKTMVKHGIVDWTYLEERGLEVPYEDRSRKVRTYWEILSERGVATGTLNWWASYPPPPLRSGYLISDRFRVAHRASPPPDAAWPPSLYDEVMALAPKRRREIREEMERRRIPEWRVEDATLPLGDLADLLGAYTSFVAQDLTVERAADHFWSRKPVRVFSAYFRLVDVTSHLAWHYLDRRLHHEVVALERAGRLGSSDVARLDREFGRILTPVYRFMDAVVEKYLGRMDDGTLLIVCSDHGFRYSKGGYRHAQGLPAAPDGVIFIAGPGVKRGARLDGATLFDVAPTILYFMGQPAAADMDGDVLRDALEERYLRAHPLRTIATYETGPRAMAAGTAGGRETDENVLEDLRALGYIGGASPASAPRQ